MDAESQSILNKIKGKFEELNREITTLKLRKECPFYNDFGNKIVCPYKDNRNMCYNVDVAPGNGDAWCTIMIERGIDPSDDNHDDGEWKMSKENDWLG